MTPAPPSLFRTVAPIIIVVAVAAVCGRILNANRVWEADIHRADPGRSAATILTPLAATDVLGATALFAAVEDQWSRIDPDDETRIWPKTRPASTPMFGSNDRSRWATVRALVENGTYVIGLRIPTEVKPGYLDVGIIFEDGYQSLDKVLKPEPDADGVRQFYSSKPPLYSTLLAGEYWVLRNVVGWTMRDHVWYVVRTILLTVNALPFALYMVLLMRLVDRLGATDWGKLFVLAAAGFATFLTTFAVTLNNHSPAAYGTLFALAAAIPLWEQGGGSWRSFAVAGFFAAFTACVELPAASFAALLFLLLLIKFPRQTLLFCLPAMLLPVAAFFVTNYLALGKWTPAYGEFGGPWYEFEGSSWKVAPGEIKRGIDWAFQHEGRGMYVLHFLLGHHGVFALTPLWLLTLGGAAAALNAERRKTRPWLPVLALMTVLLSIVVIGFYLAWIPRWNYGGWTSGPRWLMWLTPLWLLTLLPAADWLAERRWGRGLGYVLLGVSVLSASYPAWNPWRQPWLYVLMDDWGWIPY